VAVLRLPILRLSLLVALAAYQLHAGSLPKRIVSLSPSTTELLYGVGAFSRVVGVSQFCTYPREVAKLPRVGGWENSDIERIVALRPDLVVLIDSQVPLIGDKLKTFGIGWISVPSQNLNDIYVAMTRIGAATGNEQAAVKLAEQTRAALERIRQQTSKLPKRSVLLSVSRTPGTLSELYAATAGSYLIDLVEIAGGKSAVAPAPTGYGRISKEAILAADPDIIIDFVASRKSKFGEQPLSAWNDLPELRAVREKHLYAMDDEFAPHPSQFAAHTAELFQRIVHPESLSNSRP
jgi:iron complex transport system substrate-binding protein